MKKFFVLLFAVSSLAIAQQDTAAHRAATSIVNPEERAKALEQFLVQYPDTKLKTRTYDGLFDLYVEQGKEAAAVAAASNSLASVSPENRMNPYNRFAYALALKNIGLDSALAWIVLAEEMAQKISPRNVSGFQDTRAYVLYRKGRSAEAGELQRTAIIGHERDPEYVSHLALYEHANGKMSEALKTMASALYLGGDSESKDKFLTWMSEAQTSNPQQKDLKKSIVMSVVHAFIDTLKGEKLLSARSNAAMLMADLGVDLPTAQQWAETAVRSLNKNSSLSDLISYKESLSLVLSAQNKHSEALRNLKSVEDLVDPYESKYWNVLGKTYEQLGEYTNAAYAYLNGLIPWNDIRLRAALEILYSKHQWALSTIDNTLDSLRKASTTFDPGHYGKNTTPSGKVVLAELFTGAECGPCASSDLAVDALAEYYPRSAVAIIEYHVHIPGPDPMTTDASWDRYKLYEGQGTPTIVVDGRESIIGGGPKTVARNRFGVYRYAIRKFESEKPQADLSLSIKNDHDKIAVTAQVKQLGKSSGNPVLHVALIERSVDYAGSNGITKHAFVMRHLFDGAEGSALNPKESAQTVNTQVDLADVEKTISAYLDSPTTQRSWSTRRAFTGWKSRPEKLDRSRLAIVAWVQDMKSKTVLQSVYEELSLALGIK